MASARRCFSSRFQSKKKRVEVLEKEPEAPGSMFQKAEQQQQYQQGQQYGQAPSSSFPSYVGSQRREEEKQGTQWDALTDGAVQHMRKVYATLATGIGIAAGASMFSMATPLVAMHPGILGLASLVPLMGIMYTSNRTHSPALRAGLFALFTGLSGVALAPLLFFSLKLNPMLVPQALLLTTGLFGSMTALSMFAKPGSALRFGVPLAGGMFILMGCGLASFLVPVTSAWYPILHNVSMYGGLALFTLYIAYDTQKMIDEYEMGEDDHIKHATDLFLDFKMVFTRILMLLGLSSDD